MRGVFAASAAFHGLLRDQKMAVALDANHRGFIPINTSTDVNSKLADVKRPNQSESFMMMREDGVDAPGCSGGRIFGRGRTSGPIWQVFVRM